MLDFGVARAASRQDGRLTVAGTFVGTPAYCAPEQVFGHAVGREPDVYAIGVTLFQMLTGACPFEGDFSEIFAAKGQGQIPSARRFDPSLPREVDETIARAMALLAANRFATARGRRTCARRANSAVVCWGVNDWGQLGDSTTTDRHTPVMVTGV